MSGTKTKATEPIDTSAGTVAYKLATAHEADVAPRIPAGTLAALASALTLLGADPNPQPAPAAGGTPAAVPPTLMEAMVGAVEMISAVREAIHGARAPAAVRKAYGVNGRTPAKETTAVVAEGRKILARAQANPSEALSLGILPADTDALGKVLDDVTAAELAAKSKGAGAKGGPSVKDLRAAEARMHEAVARIAGAGILAFARNAAVRSAFEALKPKKA
jgi:hypothetical protein